MSEPSSTPTEKAAVVTSASLCRLWNLVIVSLALNGLILVLFILGAILHHQQGPPPRLADRGDREGRFEMMGPGGFGRHFHKFAMERRWEMRGFGGGFRERGGMPMDKDFGSPPGMPGMMGPGPGQNGPPTPAQMTDKIVNGLTHQLSLTDDQKAKLRPIIEPQVTQMQKDMEAQRQAMQKLMDDTKAKIKPILNADQQKQLDQIKLPPGPPPMPPPPVGQPPQDH